MQARMLRPSCALPQVPGEEIGGQEIRALHGELRDLPSLKLSTSPGKPPSKAEIVPEVSQ